MVSRTKFALELNVIKKLFAEAGIEGVTEALPLGAGEFNAVYEVVAGGSSYVLKIAPKSSVAVMTYENDMMASEVFWYGVMRSKTSVRVPEVYYSSTDGKIIPADWFIMEKIEGKQLDKMDLSPVERKDAEAVKTRMAADIHTVKGERYGYIQNGLHADWYSALNSMIGALIQDAEIMGYKTKRGKKLLGFVKKYKPVLQSADCRMVNFDIWSPNIMCRRGSIGLEYIWIDPERSFWGDSIADFVCLGNILAPLNKKQTTIDNYNAVSSEPVSATRGECVRYAVMQGYLGLLMEVEKYYRYSLRHFGWYRNVLMSRLLLNASFKALK